VFDVQETYSCVVDAVPHHLVAVDLAPVVLLEDEGCRLTIHDVNEDVVVPWGLWVEVQQLEERQKRRHTASLPQVQRLSELLVREADQVVDIGLAERSRPNLDLVTKCDVIRLGVRVDDEAAPVVRLTRDDRGGASTLKSLGSCHDLAMLVGPKVLIQKILPGELLVACPALVLNLAWWYTLVLSIDMGLKRVLGAQLQATGLAGERDHGVRHSVVIYNKLTHPLYEALQSTGIADESATCMHSS
jgi:hypothetical protein